MFFNSPCVTIEDLLTPPGGPLVRVAPKRSCRFADEVAGVNAGPPGAPLTEAPADEPQRPDAQQVVTDLQDENQRLRQQIEHLQTAHSEVATVSQDLADAAEENEQLRKRLGQLAVTDSLRIAAEKLGLTGDVVAPHVHRFNCRIDPGGQVRIDPNPTEFLLDELKRDPLLARAAEEAERSRRADAAIHTTVGAGASDPVELLSVLDRDPGKKARFIARHGTEAFVDLANRARRQGRHT